MASPFPLLAAIGANTNRIEIGTAVIDMRYENPLYMAGGASTGPRTPEGLQRCAAAHTKHGTRNADARAQATERAKARAATRGLNRLVADLEASAKEVIEDS